MCSTWPCSGILNPTSAHSCFGGSPTVLRRGTTRVRRWTKLVTVMVATSTLRILGVILVCASACRGKIDCWGRPYGAPGFVSDRRLFPLGESIWDQHQKVAFQNADCTWLVGNFRDTGSRGVVILFSAATIHKEWWPSPQIQQRLAVEHNVSSIAVDIAGRGESCGYEVGPGCESTVSRLPAELLAVAVQRETSFELSLGAVCRSKTWPLQCVSSILCLADMLQDCLVSMVQYYFNCLVAGSRNALSVCQHEMLEVIWFCMGHHAGLSSGGKAALLYAAQIGNVPSVFMAEPDDIAILSGKLSMHDKSVARTTSVMAATALSSHMRLSHECLIVAKPCDTAMLIESPTWSSCFACQRCLMLCCAYTS